MMHKAFSDPAHVPGRFSVKWARVVAWVLAHVIYRTTTDGRANVPRTGGVVLASNHVSLLDGPLIMGVAPRGVHFLIKKELTKGIAGPIMYGAGQISVDRGHGHDALVVAKHVLDSGRVVGLFPEGTRSMGRVQSVKAGVAWLAVHAQVPVVPVAVLGSRRTGESAGKWPGFRRHLHISFGEPIELSLSGDEKADCAAGIETIKQALTEHVMAAEARVGIELPRDEPRRKPKATPARVPGPALGDEPADLPRGDLRSTDEKESPA